jgi:hypothetical protein
VLAVIITCALVWYDERPEDLEACIRGMADIADKVVAVDGAYRRYPDAHIASPPEQADTIRRVAAEVGLECDVVVPDRLWAGQIEKRSFVLQRASVGTDWIAIVDTDWIIHADRATARKELQRCHDRGVDVVTVTMSTPSGDAAPATNWHQRMSGTRTPIQHFFRPLPDLKVETLHWYYSATKNGQKVWMWHGRRRRGAARLPILPPYPLRARYLIEHVTFQRDQRHILAGRAFCNDREMVLRLTGQEDDVPGLPPPVFDYDTVPY